MNRTKSYYFIFLYFSLISNIFSQDFQSKSNQYYWKNKKPFNDYWQQDIDYKINAYLDQNSEIIIGDLTLVYTNNSPDSLESLYFNLYQNAFVKNSYLQNLHKANSEEKKLGFWEEKYKGNEVYDIKVDNQKIDSIEIDGTILKISLPKAIQKKSKAIIELRFKTYYSKGGSIRRRMKSFDINGTKHFNGAHWYPRIAVYDRKFGWFNDQHLNREFYGDFGSFDVTLDFPEDFIVEATGILQNKDEALSLKLRQQLDIKNFLNKDISSKINPIEGLSSTKRKKWHFKAENVHDFAWVAGPLYRILDTTYDGLKVCAMVLEPNCKDWLNSIQFTRDVMSVYSKDFGKYIYSKMVVVDCEDGMEYPMLTMNRGKNPSYKKLLAHEVGHNWFYGMVNNNETYSPLLDEGFTQFLTIWALNKVDGIDTKSKNAYASYFKDINTDNQQIINTHSDCFNGATGQGGGYRLVYTKTAVMLFNLQYILGDSVFQDAMKFYFDQWSFCHPYVEDFRNSIIRRTKVDLNWFFDQWLNTDKKIDYSIDSLKQIDSNKYIVSLSRLQNMQMPLELTVFSNSSKYNFYIPNTWFEKKYNKTNLKRWIGWDNKLNKEYSDTLIFSQKTEIDSIVIDTSRRLADINFQNNTLVFGKNLITPKESNTRINISPLIRYNNFDGIKLGIKALLLNSFFDYTKVKFWFNSGFKDQLFIENYNHGVNHTPFGFEIKIKNKIDKKDSLSANLRANIKSNNGVNDLKLSFSNKLSKVLKYNIEYNIFNGRENSINYFYSPIFWNNSSLYSMLNFTILYNKSLVNFDINNTTKIATNLFSPNEINFIENEFKLIIKSKKIYFINRFYNRLGIEHFSNLNKSLALKLNIGGANGYEMSENEFTQAIVLPFVYNRNIDNSSHIHYKGGINLRGYNTIALIDNENKYAYNSGSSLNSQLNFEKLIFKNNIIVKKIKFDTYLFSDIGNVYSLTYSSTNSFIDISKKSKLLMDAGFGIEFSDLKDKNIDLRFEVPFFLSSPTINDNSKQIKFRWQIGINKAI